MNPWYMLLIDTPEFNSGFNNKKNTLVKIKQKNSRYKKTSWENLRKKTNKY